MKMGHGWVITFHNSYDNLTFNWFLPVLSYSTSCSMALVTCAIYTVTFLFPSFCNPISLAVCLSSCNTWFTHINNWFMFFLRFRISSCIFGCYMWFIYILDLIFANPLIQKSTSIMLIWWARISTSAACVWYLNIITCLYFNIWFLSLTPEHPGLVSSSYKCDLYPMEP